jgi:hypothetical protein
MVVGQHAESGRDSILERLTQGAVVNVGPNEAGGNVRGRGE